jgi:asparagine synthase (glutamine-hydrolysing)
MVAELIVLMPEFGTRCFFKDIARVEPGHVVTVTRDGISSRRYWQPQRSNGRRLRSSDYVEGLRYHLDQATLSRLRGVNGAVGAQLSGGLDSGAVTATAARLLAPRGGRVIAFTAVPRAGYDNPGFRNCLTDEGPLAATTAAMYPNVEHVLIRAADRSPLDGLDRELFLCDRPILNPCNAAWVTAIEQAAHQRDLRVLLVGLFGNMTATYDGLPLLSELLRTGSFVKLRQLGHGLVENAGMSPRGVLIQMLGALCQLDSGNGLSKKPAAIQTTFSITPL